MRLLQRTEIRSEVMKVNLIDAVNMDAAFATNTSIGVRAINTFNEIDLTSAHPVIEELRESYQRVLLEPI